MPEKHMVTGTMFHVVRNYGEHEPVIIIDGQVIKDVVDLSVVPEADKAR